LDVIDRKMTLLEAFRLADGVLGQGVKGISDLITTPGLINVDFADVKTIMSEAGSALMGIGTGTGENRAQTAARSAISSPLLEISIDGAKGILMNIIGGTDLTMSEVSEAADIISQSADPDANIIFGAAISDELEDQIRITVIATGFNESKARLAQIARQGVLRAGIKRSFQPPMINPMEEKPMTPAASTEFDTNQHQSTNKNNNNGEYPEDTKFDIPAFLRQGR